MPTVIVPAGTGFSNRIWFREISESCTVMVVTNVPPTAVQTSISSSSRNRLAELTPRAVMLPPEVAMLVTVSMVLEASPWRTVSRKSANRSGARVRVRVAKFSIAFSSVSVAYSACLV